MSELDKYTNYKTILAVVAVLRFHGKILLLKRSSTKKVDPGLYSGVGGKVEPGESFLEAIVREVHEETGLLLPKDKFRPTSLLQVPDPSNNAEWVMAIFVVDIDEEVKIPRSGDGDFHWVNPGKINNLPILPDLADYLRAITKNPDAFVLTFCRYDEKGNVVEKKTNIF